MPLAAERIGSAIGIELLEGTAHDRGLVLLAVDLRRIDTVEHGGTHQAGMPAHHLEAPARAVGYAVDVDAAKPHRRRQIGHVVGQHRRVVHAEVDLAAVDIGPAARQYFPLLLFGDGAAARLGRFGHAVVEAVEIGRRPTRAALTQDDHVALAADHGGLVPPVAFGQRVGAGGRGHQRRIAWAAREINQRLDAGRTLGLEDGDLQLDLAALRLVAILRDDQHEALDPVAARRLERAALTFETWCRDGALCQNEQKCCQAAQEPHSRHGYVLPHRGL